MHALAFPSVTAIAPGKIILFGEHAINRGEPALAAAIGLYARCTVRPANTFQFSSRDHFLSVAPNEILELGTRVEAFRQTENFEAIRQLAQADYFAPQQYVLASMFGSSLPEGLAIEWDSAVPSSAGLGSGGSAFTAMVAAVSATLCSSRRKETLTKSKIQNPKSKMDQSLVSSSPSMEQRADWAHRGDIIAHGGIASALDTQTSLLGGMVLYTGNGLAEPVPCAPGLSVVIGNTGIVAPTSEVNTHVRLWLAAKPASRLTYIKSIGALVRAALPVLVHGDWEELGRLFLLNQLALEKIGVSSPEIDRLITAALDAGAYGAKISGSGGGGSIIALASPEKKQAVAEALAQAGGKVFTLEIGVDGVRMASAPIANHRSPLANSQ